MKEKIAHLMKSESLSSNRLAEILEIQPSAVSHLLSGRNKPRYDLLQKILRRFPSINPDWLLLDSEQMYRDSESTPGAKLAGDAAMEPLNLFDDDGSFSLGDLLGDGTDFGQSTASHNPNFSEQNSSSFQGQNPREFNDENSSQNWGSLTPQNDVQNRAKITPQNRREITPQNRTVKSENSSPENRYYRPYVERVIVLYSDNTCRTYDMRK